MDAASRLFLRAVDDGRKLSRHGFGGGWPDTEELARRVMEHDEALIALAGHLGLRFQVDSRGRVNLAPRGGENDVI